VAFVFIFIAFVSPYWLETDGKLKDPKFLNIGEFLGLLRLLIGVVVVHFAVNIASEKLCSFSFVSCILIT
jgi:hypothetical protein